MKNEISKKEIIQLYVSGLSQKDISIKYNVPYSEIHETLEEAGFLTANYRKVKPEFCKKVKKLIELGYTAKQIAAELDVSEYTVLNVIYNHDMKGIAPKVRKKNTIKKIVDEYNKGLSASSVSKNLQIDINTVIKILKSQGCYKSQSRRVNRSDEEVNDLKIKANTLYQQGMLYQDIQKELKISYRYLKKLLAA